MSVAVRWHVMVMIMVLGPVYVDQAAGPKAISKYRAR